MSSIAPSVLQAADRSGDPDVECRAAAAAPWQKDVYEPEGHRAADTHVAVVRGAQSNRSGGGHLARRQRPVELFDEYPAFLEAQSGWCLLRNRKLPCRDGQRGRDDRSIDRVGVECSRAQVQRQAHFPRETPRTRRPTARAGRTFLLQVRHLCERIAGNRREIGATANAQVHPEWTFDAQSVSGCWRQVIEDILDAAVEVHGDPFSRSAWSGSPRSGCANRQPP